MYDVNPLGDLGCTGLIDSGRPYTCLAIDGEGMQALMASITLNELERRTGYRICELFDCITGSSFGAILALGLVASRDNTLSLLTTKKLLDLFYKHGDTIFSRKRRVWETPHYPLGPLQMILHSYFKDVHLSDALTRVLIPCMQEKAQQGIIFDSIDAQKRDDNDFLMHQIAAVASADPAYFPSACISNVSKTARQHFVASSKYKNDAASVIRDKIFDKIPQHVIMLTVSAGVSNEANSMTHTVLKEKLGTDYCRMQPTVDAGSIGMPDNTDPRLLDRYIAYARSALDGNEAFIRRLRENRKKS